MNLMGLQGGQYEPLSPEQVINLHEAALKILENIGFTYEQGLEDTVGMFESNGAVIDKNRQNIIFPRNMIEQQVAKAPEKVVLYGQETKNDLHLTQNRVHLGTGGSAIKILDPKTGEARPTTLKDLYDVSRLVDQLDNIHFLVKPCIATDIDVENYNIN
ncbi:MAG: hypothetical protein GY857_01065 [Desulfobacula sp.]|nr:hypothetical protein [Desulfobacula sp.]